MSDTAFCAALAHARAAPADPLAVHDVTIELEALVAAADALLGTVCTVRTRFETLMEPAEYAPTHEDWAADDLRRAVTAAKAALDAGDGA